MATTMNNYNDNGGNRISSFLLSKQQQQQQQHMHSDRSDYSDSGSDDVYYSDASTESSDMFDDKEYVIGLDAPSQATRHGLYEDEAGCVDTMYGDRGVDFGHSPQQTASSSPVDRIDKNDTTKADSDSDSSSVYSNEIDDLDNESFHLGPMDAQDNQIHGDTSTTISTITGKDDIRNMSSSSLSSSLCGNSLAGDSPDVSLDPSTQSTTPTIMSDECDDTNPSSSQSLCGAISLVPDEDYNAVNLEIVTGKPTSTLAPTLTNCTTQLVENLTASPTTTRRLSAISTSDLNEIPLFDESTATGDSGFGKSSPASGAMINTTPSTANTMASPTSFSMPASPISIDTSTATIQPKPSASMTTRRLVSGLWSPFRSATMPPSKKVTRPSANFAERQKRQSRPPSCVLPGFQEALLNQMEQSTDSKQPNVKNRHSLALTPTTPTPTTTTTTTTCSTDNEDYDWIFWTSVICDDNQVVKNKALSSHLHKGIPPSLRGTVWQLVSNSRQLMEEQHYMDLLRTPSPYDKMIQRDLARTFPHHKYFKEKDGVGQEALYNVVRAYSLYDPEVGYCQGLAFIVGPLLLNMPDEEAICVLIRLMSHYGLRGHFTPNMEGLHLRLYQFESLVVEHLPHISRHLKHHEINPTMFASQWFMTLFAYKFPLDLVFRIYDMVFVEGLETTLLMFALALLKRNEAHLLELDFEPLLTFLKNDLFEEYKNDERQLVQDAQVWQISRKRLDQLEKEHKARMIHEEQNTKALESLQKHQGTLRLQVDQLTQSRAASQKEYHDVQAQLQDSQYQRQQMEDEQGLLKTMVESLQTETTTIPRQVEATFKPEFDKLCHENTQLNQRNAHLEDQLAAMEALLIDIKMRYAQSQDQGDDLSKRLFELKKIMG